MFFSARKERKKQVRVRLANCTYRVSLADETVSNLAYECFVCQYEISLPRVLPSVSGRDSSIYISKNVVTVTR